MILDKRYVQVIDPETDIVTVMKRIVYSEKQEDGFYVCDLSDIISKYKNWKNTLPRVKTFYAVKCNDSKIVLNTLASLGSGFDCASREEIRKILSLGVSPDRIIFANTVKKESHIQYAAENGIHTMTFDSENELYKIKKYHSRAKLVLRLKFDDTKASVKLGKKFGVDSELEAYNLLKLAQAMDMDVIGVCFHIGSGFKDISILLNAIIKARKIFDLGLQLGYYFKLLDIGGGFPGSKETSIEKLGSLIDDTLEKYFPDYTVEVISEPGRYFVASAYTLVSNIHTKKIVKRITSGNEVEYIRMYYLDVGIYNSINLCLLYDTNINNIFPLEKYNCDEMQKKYPSIVWGPTCDPNDKFSNDIGQLPEMEEGDWLVIENAGAYTLSIACEFNGFPLPKIHCIIKKNDVLLLTEEVTHPLPKDIFVEGNKQEIFLLGLKDKSNYIKASDNKLSCEILN